MNSDNTAVGGVTIDYGPFGMLEKCAPAHLEPKTLKMNPEPETRNTKHETQNLGPETRNVDTTTFHTAGYKGKIFPYLSGCPILYP